MAKILTKDFTLSYKLNTEGATFVALHNLQEVPEIGNTAKEKIDVTTLEDEAKKSIDGLGDTTQDLAFKFLIDATSNSDSQFDTLCGIDESINWKVSHAAAGIEATFTGTPSVKIDSASVNNAVSYTLTVSVDSLIEFA